jgi:hypothetical protein
MPKATNLRKREPITPAESAISVAAALEMLLLVGGLLWAVNTPPGVSLWPRILTVSGIAILAAVIAVLVCAPLFRSTDSESAKTPSSSDDSAHETPKADFV